MLSATLALPALRDDLAVLPGPAGHDGAPSWTLHDPVSNRFFRLSWPAFEVLTRWHLGDPAAVAASVRRDTVLDIDVDAVGGVVEFLARSQLLKAAEPEHVARLLAIHDAGKTSWAIWLLHHYLFFRLPLVRPDAMLDAALPWVAWLGSRAFRFATFAALAVGLVLVARQWEVFAATFVDHVSLGGLAAFGVALGVAKVCHELGHAFAAKTFGCRVPTMGVAFLVLWPMLYTDVNEAWKLSDRRRRLLIGAAGILAELALAAWATLAWALLPDGTARSLAFTLAATTWISSLAVNLSPFMRFDGYFLAMDALDQPNLHPRAFALARWHLREVLFGLGEPSPEALPPRLRLGMIAFAWAVWLYRLTLFLGIALLVYHFFIKVVGVILFAVEIGWFVVKPIAAEMEEWASRLGTIRATRRSRRTLFLFGGLLLVVAVPWSGRVSAPALLKANEYAVLYAPAPGIVATALPAEGQRVVAGEVLVHLHNPDALLRLEQTERRIRVLRYEWDAVGFEDSFRARAKAIAEELEGAVVEKSALAADLRRLTLTASFAGIVSDVSPGVQTGQWINSREPILVLHRGGQVEAYVDEADLPRLAVGAGAWFLPEGGGGRMAARVVAIDRIAVKALSEPSLAVPFGGDIPARFADRQLVPDAAVYRVRMALVGEATVAVPLRGRAHMDGERRSLLGHAARAMAAVVIREWGT
ncbi:MAG: HlyD family efflux transporter periplasmic adaptor subunit [Magnetospirillum sp.]|nr:HlyD family efflux transporter periplasmic adaptor subunit [Magnetospirillum sp.]